MCFLCHSTLKIYSQINYLIYYSEVEYTGGCYARCFTYIPTFFKRALYGHLICYSHWAPVLHLRRLFLSDVYIYLNADDSGLIIDKS